MKILMFGWEFAPIVSGGLGVACAGLTKGLLEHGVDVHLVLPKTPAQLKNIAHLKIYQANYTDDCSHDDLIKEFLEFSKLKKISFSQIDTLLRPYTNEKNYTNKNSSYLENQHDCLLNESSTSNRQYFEGGYGENLLSEVFRYAQVAKRFAMKIPHDVIHSHDWLTVMAGIEAKSVSGSPLIFHVHSLETDRNPNSPSNLIQQIERYGLHLADRILTVSYYTKNQIIKHYQIDPAKIHVVYNGLTPMGHASKPPASSRKIVSFIGRVTTQKGPDCFVNMARYVLSKRRDVHFLIAGEGDQFRSLVEKVANERIGSYVHFLGFLNKQKASELYQKSDIVVMPSVSEPFGLVALEALSCEVPVIISAQSGVAEVLSSALKVNFWDVEAFASRVLALLKHDALRKEILSQAKHDLAEQTWAKIAKNVKTHYNGLR